MNINLKSRGQPVLWDQWKGSHGSDRQILCVQPASGEAMASPAGTALWCSAHTLHLSLSKELSSAMVKPFLGPQEIAVTYNPQPASEPTLVQTLIYSRNSLKVWAVLSEEALGAGMPMEYHNQIMTSGDVSAGSDPCMCLLCHILQWPLRKENAV